jgi:hypothetical protein
MREIATPLYLLINGHIVKPAEGHELVVFERRLPAPAMPTDDIRKMGRPSRDGKKV